MSLHYEYWSVTDYKIDIKWYKNVFEYSITIKFNISKLNVFGT